MLLLKTRFSRHKHLPYRYCNCILRRVVTTQNGRQMTTSGSIPPTLVIWQKTAMIDHPITDILPKNVTSVPHKYTESRHSFLHRTITHIHNHQQQKTLLTSFPKRTLSFPKRTLNLLSHPRPTLNSRPNLTLKNSTQALCDMQKPLSTKSRTW